LKTPIIATLIENNNKRLNSLKEDYAKTLKSQLNDLDYFSTNSIENLITSLTRLQSSVGKCEGVKQELDMLEAHFRMLK
jgi:hypothetical protein